MKKLNTKPGLWIILAALGILSFWACNKQSVPDINAETSSLGYVLANGTNTTIFNAAVVKAGLDSLFSGPSIFTLFVPNDQACTQSGFPQSVIDGFTRSQARQWVLYQTYAGTALTLESFIGKTNEPLLMADGDSIFITGDSNRTYANGNQMLNSEVKATNGMMLALQYVLVAPTQNLAQMISNDTSLSFLNEAILLSSPIPDSLSTLLSTGGPFTFFAPVNDAFRNLGFTTPADLSVVNPDTLRNMILTSMIPQRIFSYNIADSATYLTVNDSTLLFINSGIQESVQILGSPFSSNALTINAMAFNGVLFKIDAILGY
jgi:transforming growth factor-beta-induced protein